MTIQLYAQPYDLAAAGFYFYTAEEYHKKSSKLRNDYGEIVEEFEIQFVPGENNFENSKFVAQIAAKSIDTDNVIRDMDLKSENFFFVEKFPMITFHRKSFTKVDNSKYKMTGELTMRGETREVELEVLPLVISTMAQMTFVELQAYHWT